MSKQCLKLKMMKSNDIEILDFTAEKVDEVLQIQTECKLSTWLKSDYLNEIEKADSIFKIAQTADEKVIGFVLVRLLIGNSNASDIFFDSAEILNIAVSNSFQKKGIGQMIFDEILESLMKKNIRKIWLEVRKSNANAISFYQKNFFEIQFERKNYYSDPTEDALLFRRSIKN